MMDRDELEILEKMLEKAKDFHGHVCPFLALGVKASWIAMKKLNLKKMGESESIEEDIIAIVECNNCFADGVQITTGCTFGNNGLVYIDVGKNALTLVKRSSWRGVRVYLDAERVDEHFPRDVKSLFDKVVVRREGEEKERLELSRKWEEMGYRMLEVEDVFTVQEVEVDPVEQAPIFANVRCDECGELVMKTKVVKNGRTLCLKCAGDYYAVIGRGVVRVERGNVRDVLR